MLRCTLPIISAVFALQLSGCVTSTPQASESDEDTLIESPSNEGRTAKKGGKKKQPAVTDEFRIDPLPALGDGPDDFQDLDKRAEAYEKEAKVESEDSRIERELREIREAEAKAKIVEEQLEAQRQAELRRKAREEHDASVEHNRKVQRAADEKAKSLKGIDKDELEWNGLN
jgi:hypothetical protein